MPKKIKNSCCSVCPSWEGDFACLPFQWSPRKENIHPVFLVTHDERAVTWGITVWRRVWIAYSKHYLNAHTHNKVISNLSHWQEQRGIRQDDSLNWCRVMWIWTELVQLASEKAQTSKSLAQLSRPLLVQLFQLHLPWFLPMKVTYHMLWLLRVTGHFLASLLSPTPGSLCFYLFCPSVSLWYSARLLVPAYLDVYVCVLTFFLPFKKRLIYFY